MDRKKRAPPDVGESVEPDSGAARLRRARAERARARARERREIGALLAEAGQPPLEAGPNAPLEEPASPAAAFRRDHRLQRAAARWGRPAAPEEGAGEPADVAHLGLTEMLAEDLVDLFDELRGAGLKPHPWAECLGDTPSLTMDWRVARGIAAALARLRSGRGGSPEANLAPNPAFGVLNAKCLVDGQISLGDSSGVEDLITPEAYGHAWDVLVDMALLGAGLVRHPHAPDLAWYKLDHSGLAEGDRFPAPGEVHDHLHACGWAAMARFTLFTLVAYLAEVKVMGILFSYGAEAVPDALLAQGIEGEVGYASELGLTWEDFKSLRLKVGKPLHQGALGFVSSRGWDPFYWDLDLDHKDPARYFEQFCLCFWWPDMDEPRDPYHQECARRKSLGAAAYGQAVGEYLAALNAFFRGLDPDVTLADVVPTLEVGNEWDAIWYRYRPLAPFDLTPEETAENEARFGELARLMVMVTGPIRALCPDIPFTFRFPDLLGWVNDEPFDDWYRRLKWVQLVLVRGVAGECARLDRFRDAEAFVRVAGADPEAVAPAEDDFAAWYATCQEAGFSWPTLDAASGRGDLTPAGFVQEVGSHYFHATDSDEQYRDETRFPNEVDYFQSIVTSHAEVASLFPGIAWSLSGIQFQAWAPAYAASADPNLGSFYFGTTPLYQGGLLVRRLLFLNALGSSRALWHTFMSNLKDKQGPWLPGEGQYNSNGLRNDVVDSEAGPDDRFAVSADAFTRERHAWRRPAWFAYRRLLWLLSQASECSIVVCSASAHKILLRLTSASGFGSPDAIASTEKPRRYAWVAWIDETSTLREWTFHLLDPVGRAGSTFRPLGLVPAQDLSTLREGEAGSFPEGDDTLDWTGAGFGQTTSTAQAKGAWVQVTVQRASPDNPAPICILTDLPTTDIVVVPAGPGGEIHRRWPGDNPFGIDLEGGDGEGPEGEEPWDGTRRPEEALEPWEIRSRWRGDNPLGIDLEGGDGEGPEGEEPWDGTRRPEEALEPWEIRSRRRGDNPFGIDLGGGAGGSTESEEPIEIPPTGIARTGPQDPDFLGSGVQEPDQDDDVFPPRGSS